MYQTMPAMLTFRGTTLTTCLNPIYHTVDGCEILRQLMVYSTIYRVSTVLLVQDFATTHRSYNRQLSRIIWPAKRCCSVCARSESSSRLGTPCCADRGSTLRREMVLLVTSMGIEWIYIYIHINCARIIDIRETYTNL